MTTGKRTKVWIGTAPLVIVAGVLAVVLWPAPDPLAGVNTVAILLPDWERDPADRAVQGPFMDGLTVTLNKRNVRIVADAGAADAVLAVQEVRVDSIELRLDSGQLRGRMSAACVLTDLRTGRTHRMDLQLQLGDGTVRATLRARRFWEFRKQG